MIKQKRFEDYIKENFNIIVTMLEEKMLVYIRKPSFEKITDTTLTVPS
jgi:uncharacterized protein YneF (UPF0154 family)